MHFVRSRNTRSLAQICNCFYENVLETAIFCQPAGSLELRYFGVVWRTWTSLKYVKTTKFGKMPGLRFSYFLRLPETYYIGRVFAQINIVFFFLYSNRYIIVYTDLFGLIDIVWIVTMPLTSSSFCRSSLSVSDILFSKCGPESLFSLLWTRENKITCLLGCIDYIRSVARSINKIERSKWKAGCLG